MKFGDQPPKGRHRFAACCWRPSRTAATRSWCPWRSAADLSAPARSARRGPRCAPANEPAAESLPVLPAVCGFRRLDPESDALRISGAVDQGHRPGGAGEEASRGGARQGSRVRRGGDQFDAVPGRNVVGASRRRRAGRLGIPIAIAAVRHLAGVLAAGSGPESVGCVRNRRRAGGRRRRTDSGRQLPRLVFHRRADHPGGNALYRAVHGRRPPAQR